MRLSELERYHPITVQCHDNPDADAMAAGYGLYCYYKSKNLEVHLIYSGPNKIKKANLKLMVEKLGIPIEYYPPGSRERIPGLLITVDCQYGAGNVTYFPAEEVAIIDHHPLEVSHVEKIYIQPNVGSCATLVWSMLKEEKYVLHNDLNLSTALYYGLYTDTNQFAELFNPLDMDMRESVAFNKSLITLFRNSNLSLKELEIAGIAMIRYNFNEEYHFAVIRAQPCDPNILGLISDFLLQVDEIDACVVYNEVNDGYKLSVRSCIKEVKASELAKFLTEGIGSGGGHFEKAGGFISRKLYEEAHPTLHSEAYFNNRMTEYFDSFSVIFAKDMELDLADMKIYCRSKRPMCCVKVSDLFDPGTQFTLRTREGDRDMLLGEEMYILLERDGTSQIYSGERFERYFKLTGRDMPEDYYEKSEYIPAAKEWTNGNSFILSDYARICFPNEQFCIYAKPLKKGVKVFTKWDEEKYQLGMPGDYLAVSAEDPHDIFIEEKDCFSEKYEQITL